MSIRLQYETAAGTLDEGATFAQLIEYLRLAQEAAATIGHYKKSQDDTLRGQGFLAIAEMLGMTCTKVTDLATRGLRH